MIRNIFGLEDLDTNNQIIIDKKGSINNEYLFWNSNRGWEFKFIEVLIIKDESLDYVNIKIIHLKEGLESEFRESINYFDSKYGVNDTSYMKVHGKRIKISIPKQKEGQLKDYLKNEHFSILEKEFKDTYWFSFFAHQESLELELTEKYRNDFGKFISDFFCYRTSPIINITKIGKGINAPLFYPKEELIQIDENKDLNLTLYGYIFNEKNRTFLNNQVFPLDEDEDKWEEDVVHLLEWKLLEWKKKDSPNHEYFVICDADNYHTINKIISYIKTYWVGKNIYELKTYLENNKK